VRKAEAQEGEEKLKECNKLMAELQTWLKDAKRRLEQANNEEVQLKVIHTFIYISIICVQFIIQCKVILYCSVVTPCILN
jgi:hypothetical protein